MEQMQRLEGWDSSSTGQLDCSNDSLTVKKLDVKKRDSYLTIILVSNQALTIRGIKKSPKG